MLNYKSIIKSRNTREKLLRMFDFVPDRFMLLLQYYIKFNRVLNLKRPQRFTEKLQWYKLFYRNHDMMVCVDKYKVRDYVTKKGYGKLLNDLIGCYDNVDEIEFDKLPQKFVIKDTLGGGGNSVIICKDKSQLNWEEVKIKVQGWIEKYGGKHPGREWVYENGHNKIIIEKYIDSNIDEGGLLDYKFICFSGRCEYLYGICDRQVGVKAQLGIYDRDFNLLPYRRLDENPMERVLEKPNNFLEMREIAENLSKEFPHVRVDFYDVNGKIIFGEMTFFDGSGYMSFDPDEFDFTLGSKFILPKID